MKLTVYDMNRFQDFGMQTCHMGHLVGDLVPSILQRTIELCDWYL